MCCGVVLNFVVSLLPPDSCRTPGCLHLPPSTLAGAAQSSVQRILCFCRSEQPRLTTIHHHLPVHQKANPDLSPTLMSSVRTRSPIEPKVTSAAAGIPCYSHPASTASHCRHDNPLEAWQEVATWTHLWKASLTVSFSHSFLSVFPPLWFYTLFKAQLYIDVNVFVSVAS